MRRCLFAAALLIALLSASFASVRSAAASPRADLADPMIADVLVAHNTVRQRIAQAESQRLGGTVSIPDLTWDANLAGLAQDWANQVVGQNPTPHRPADQRPGIGENTFMADSIGAPVDQSISAAMQFWASEQQYYSYDTNTCAAGQQCGHYTQVIWSSTTQVGCGRAVASLNGAEDVVWVCNYGPAGNLTINGELQRPYSVAAPPPAPGGGCTYNWTRTLELGAQGEDVAELQRRLNAAGASLDVDGDFGSVTDQAVRDFQAAHQLVVDGSVGSQTQAVLNQICPAPTSLEQQVVDLVNAERAAVGCQPLTMDARLMQAAANHSSDMATNNYFSHTGLDGSTFDSRLAAAGYHGQMEGENIAAGFGTAEAVMQGWMASPSHRDNILNCGYTQIGVGHAYSAGSDYGHYWTQEFGTP
jgi:uncharacterized protein YkwD